MTYRAAVTRRRVRALRRAAGSRTTALLMLFTAGTCIGLLTAPVVLALLEPLSPFDLVQRLAGWRGACDARATHLGLAFTLAVGLFSPTLRVQMWTGTTLSLVAEIAIGGGTPMNAQDLPCLAATTIGCGLLTLWALERSRLAGADRPDRISLGLGARP